MILLLGSQAMRQEDGRTFICDTNNELLDINEEIFAPFCDHVFHEFAGLPKIFILNCSEGDMDPRIEPKHHSGIDFRPLETFKSDMCIVLATTDGTNNRSPLIQTLCNTIIDEAKNNSLSLTEFSLILQKAQRKVREDARTQIVVENTLRKSFFLSEEGTFF